MSSAASTAPAAAASGASAAAAPAPSSALTSDLTSARVAVMTTPACPYCRRAKEALTQGGWSYVEVDVAADEKLRQAVRDVTGKRTVPQVGCRAGIGRLCACVRTHTCNSASVHVRVCVPCAWRVSPQGADLLLHHPRPT